jgi:tRNA (mo5U34)-methyltransferase
MPTPQELQEEADRHTWFHRLDLGQGVVTKAPALPWDSQQFPPFKDKSVLDIGAWDGAYSFLAEREGAARVVALDHFAWGVDMEARNAYWAECASAGVLPDHSKDQVEFWRPDLPGKRGGFDLAHRAYHSKVDSRVADFTTMDLTTLGTFDVVLYLGVLYHMPEPLTCLKRVREVTKDVAAVASLALDLPNMNDQRLVQFQPGNELGDDFGNWYLPTISALQALCQAAGFARTEVVCGPPSGPEPGLYLAMVHARVAG